MRRVMFETPWGGEVPHMGVPRIVQRSEATRTVSSVRYGIAVRFEFDQLKTPQGRADFDLALIQVR
jgi:hypothetical protein